MRDELHEAIENAYDVFPEMKWRGRNATVCTCCVSELNARDLAKIDRRDLDAELISEYLGSAHQPRRRSATSCRAFSNSSRSARTSACPATNAR